MSIKLVVLKSGEQLIADVKEIVSEEKVCAYLLENPHYVELRGGPEFLNAVSYTHLTLPTKRIV